MKKIIQHSNKSLQKLKYSKTNPLLNYKPQPYTGTPKEKLQELRKAHLNPGLFMYYKNPIHLTEGRMQYLYDEKGKKYIDCLGGILTVSVGHCHPDIVRASIEQTKKLMHSTTVYYHEEVTLFAKELADKMPGDLKVCYFVNSGSEANDLALLMAKVHTGNADIIALRNAYHGMSMSAMGLTSLHTWKYPVSHGHGIHHALCPDLYKGPYDYNDEKAADKYAWDVKNLIQCSTTGKVAGFIHETIQGVGGFIEMPDGYLPQVYKTVREHGGVCIADEVQSGFGRLGKKYWGFETKGVLPDIVTMAKGIGNGTPLAAVVTTPEIAKSLTQRIHFNTYGGNPVSSAIGREVLKIVEKDGLQENSLKQGNKLKEGLIKLQKKHSIIGDVRGQGLMLGIELVEDQKLKTPAKPAVIAEIFEKTKDNGILLGKGGLSGNVFRFGPPMCINGDDIEKVLDALDKSLS